MWQYEWNARTQITMWFDNTPDKPSPLHDYGKYNEGRFPDLPTQSGECGECGECDPAEGVQVHMGTDPYICLFCCKTLVD